MLIQYRYSNIFIFKSVCKKCKTGPKNAVFYLGKNQDETAFKTKLKRKPNNNHQFLNPAYIEILTKLRELKINVLFERNASKQRKVFAPNSKYDPPVDEFICRVECYCGDTTWEFNNTFRRHIALRKGSKLISYVSGAETCTDPVGLGF